MRQWTLINLLSINSMTYSGCTLQDGIFTFPAGQFCMINQPLPTPIVGHKYYGRVEQLVPQNVSFDDGRFEYYVTDAQGTGNIVFCGFWDSSMDNNWSINSSIQEFTGLYAQTGYILRSFSVNISKTVYRRNHMIIDLTAAFGPGNEPTKEWCDRCIPFFEGTIGIISAASGYVGIGGTAKKLATGYVGVNGAARKIIAGYVGVNGVAKSIWKGLAIDPIDFIEGNFTTYENELVISIDYYAFRDCSALTNISFPNATSIDEYAFSGCTALRTVTLLANQVCTIKSGSFPSTVEQFRVPIALVDAYKADSNWAAYSDKIVGV